MAGWKTGLAVTAALLSVPALPAPLAGTQPYRPAHTSTVPVSAAVTVPACGSAPVPPEPAPAGQPWALLRYAPDRLAPLATGAGVTVAVIDSGVDDRHPQLRGRVLPGADYLDSGGDGRLDCVAHGTAVASIIVARPQSGTEFRGLAPQATILPVRISEQQLVEGNQSARKVTVDRFADAIRWAVDHGADVLNLSVVLYEDHPAVRAAVAYAVDRDVVVVAAVGNLRENGNPTPYPAAYPGVIGVGAVGPDGLLTPFSQVGPYVDVVAPGADVVTAVPGNGYRRQQGTSYAAPFVAATAALVRDYQPDLPAAAVAARIIATTDPAPANNEGYGSGVVNPYRAVTDTVAAGSPPPVAALPLPSADPAEAARQSRRAQARQAALWLAVGGGSAVGITLVLTAVLPRGARRRWQPAEPA